MAPHRHLTEGPTMTNDQLAKMLLQWPMGTEVSVMVDVNMSVDIEGVRADESVGSDGLLRPHILIELPTPDISTVPPLMTVPSS